MIRFSLILAILFSLFSAFSQQLDMKTMKGFQPRSIGPAGMSGRVTSVDVELKNNDHILIGTASGGVWESFSGGINWKPIFDDAPVQSVGAVALDQLNPGVIWVGTGEGNPRNSHNSGKGIYKSIDGGKNWKLMGLENTKTIHRIILNPRNSNEIYVAILGSAWGPNKERGVFKSMNGGETWEHILSVNDTTGCADLVMDPSNPNKLIAAMWQYGRKPWFFNSGGKGSGMYITFDGGKTWEKRTEKDGLPKGNLGRMGLTISKNKPNVIYSLIESKKTALYRSDDGGFKWRKINDKTIGNRPFYYADIYVDPNNENRVYNLFSVVTKSEDGGKSFQTLTPYFKVHPDHHAFWINPDNSDHIIDGNDGGLTISKDGGKSWRYVTNLPLGQFYHINIDDDMPYNVYGGLQDNGSWKGPAYLFERGGIRNHHWEELLFGDGFDVVPQAGNPNKGYAMYQGGNVAQYNLENGRSSIVKPIHPEGIELRFNWNAGIAQDPHQECGVYFGSQFVHYSEDCGNNWQIISPDLTTNDTLKQKQAKSGGLTIDATKAENYTSILCIAPSPHDDQIIWVGTDDGNVQVTKDKGQSWKNLSGSISGFPKGAWIPQIQVSKHSVDEVYVVVNDYRRNNWEPYIFRTINGGTTWSRIVDGNKVKGHVWSMVQDPVEKDLLFCGTDFGLYVSVNGGNDWTQWTEGLPSVPVSDLKIQEREKDLVIGTFGRAVYILDDITILREITREQLELSKEEFQVFEPRASYRSPWKVAKGIHFTGDAEFKGRNRGSSPMITLYISPELIKTKGKKGKGKQEEQAKKDSTKLKGPKDKVEYLVLNGNNDTVRFASFKPDSNINRFYWNEREDGVDRLRRTPPKKKKDDKYKPAGLNVLPGQYTMVFFYQKFSDTCTIEIKQNPKTAIPESELTQVYEKKKAQQQEYQNVVKQVDKLKAIKKSIGEINGMLKFLPDSLADSLRKDGKAINDTINVLLDEFFLPEGFKGYDHVSVKLSNRIGRIYGYLNSENALESGTLDLAVKDFNRYYEPVNARMENLFTGPWEDYQRQVESLQFEYFKAFRELE
ncbi:MAG: hypothetical protein CL840_06760 [Crocinitomicaceae bacterium]|mgnify:CR=1 FL=1|nr:hypothetical protein [Crocinitomicaceae bacterium]|tara:strand:+ start:195 stop:3386 length:3192 start_codon:yes stop_codon:yes gene_type:complete